MARRPRRDGPDTWHHVVNRGIAKRTLFETPRDFRVFLALIAKEVRRGRIEVHAFSLMLNHFHLLVRSVTGDLGAALRHIQLGYSRWFNRTRERDGPLYRGRFASERIDSLAYRRNVVTYIHDNPVKAGIVTNPIDYAWSSGPHCARATRPRWLETTWIDDEIARRGGEGSRAAQLLQAFPINVDDAFRAQIERRLRQRIPSALDDEDVTLHYVATPRTIRWTMRKSMLADGTRAWLPAVRQDQVPDTIARLQRRQTSPSPAIGARVWRRLTVLLYRLAGLTQRAIGYLLGHAESTISGDMQDHREALRRSSRYAGIAAHVVAAALNTVA